jgi:hypothetical protein
MSTGIRIAAWLSLLTAFSLLATATLAGTQTEKRLAHSGTSLVHGHGHDPAKAVTDTVLLMGPWGSGAYANGQFQNPSREPDWNGWTSIDHTQPTQIRWHPESSRTLNGLWSAWCGDPDIPACSEFDSTGGYGNNWDEVLEWRGTVTNPADPCTVDISALIQLGIEPGYDYCYVTTVHRTYSTDIWVGEGQIDPTTLDLQATYLAGDYAGENEDEVVIQFRFVSDGAYSDEDCLFPGDDAFLLDDLTIDLDNGTGYSHDFEDGTLGELDAVLRLGVGDFAKIWTNLKTLGGCSDQVNTSPMVAFIDDGEVVPGTGGTSCISWCYGPGGFIVNNSGGLAGPDHHIHNSIISPPMPWPGEDYEGCDLAFDVWRDMTLTPGDPGIFFIWSIRSTTDPDPATLDDEAWMDRNFVYYGGPDWQRHQQVLGDLVPTQARWVQIQLGVYEIGYVWGWYGADGTPAPYFDNVRLAAYPFHGPSLFAGVNDLPHDAFPESGELDLVNLGANHIRFDSGSDIAGGYDPRNDPGDSIIVSINPMREGAELVGLPRLHYNLQRNPVFDPYRSSGLPDRGSVEGWQVLNGSGQPIIGRFAFDLPDTGFLFPGDFLYYFFAATDEVDGVQQTSTLPADTTGFSNHSHPMAYPPIYKLHALPSIMADTPGEYYQPGILFWDDAGAEGNRDEWYTSFANLGLVAGRDYDIYYTNNPRVGTGQGLGGRATALQLAGYEEMIYTSGKVTLNTLGHGDRDSDKSRDVQVLAEWLAQGGKDLFLTGDDLAGDLSRTSVETATFLEDWVGVDLVEENVLDAINLQTAPLVITEPANPVFWAADRWLGVARCATTSQYYGGGTTTGGLKRFDGVLPRETAMRLAEFTDPAGTGGAYPYSAATLNLRPEHQARVISLPYDFEGVWTLPSGQKTTAPLAERTRLLYDVLTYFGLSGFFTPSPVPEADVFTAGNHPNPFNPADHHPLEPAGQEEN